MSTYWRLVEDAASQHADEVILADDAGRSLTAAGLRDAAVTVAAGLWESGVRPGQVLSWQLPTILEVPVLMAACARLGVVQNPIIPLLRHREVGFILDQLAARAVIVPESWRGFAHAAMVREVGAEAKFESAEIKTSYCMGLLHDFIKTFVQRAAGDQPKAVPVFLRVSCSRMRLDCFCGLPFFDNREMIRPHRVL